MVQNVIGVRSIAFGEDGQYDLFDVTGGSKVVKSK
jgi:hypothetical protein